MGNYLRIYIQRSVYTAIGIVFFLLFGIAEQTFALDVQNLDYQIDNQVINQSSEHVINFDSISPISIGNSLSINFPNEFNFSTSPVQSDVEIRVNGLLLGPGDWSFSQSLNTIFISFQTTAVAGSDVEVTLKDDIDLINPSTHGQYTVNFGVNGSFVVSAQVWIFPQSSITVSAAVLGDPIIVGGGSSGGGSGTRDTTCYNCFFNDNKPFFDEQGIIVSFKGFGSPKGSVQVFIDDYYVGTTSIDEKGIFLMSVDNIASGLHTFKFIGFDKNDIATSPRTIILTVGERGFVYANDVFLPPTITVEPRGDYGLVIYGYTVPYAELDINVDENFIGTVIANGNGLYFIETSLDQFEIGEHNVVSLLKGSTRNLSSGEKNFTITSVYNSEQRQLQFVGEPLFDVLITSPNQQNNHFSISSLVPYIISFLTGALLFWGIIRLLGYRKKKQLYISEYEID